MLHPRNLRVLIVRARIAAAMLHTTTAIGGSAAHARGAGATVSSGADENAASVSALWTRARR